MKLHAPFTTEDARGACAFKSWNETCREVEALPVDFRPEMLRDRFDIAALERDCDRAKSYIAYFNADTGAVSVLWGNFEPPIFVEGVHDLDDY